MKSLRTKHDDKDSIFAWFEPSKGPCDLMGVRLAYIDPFDKHFERLLEAANKDKDTPRALNLLHSKAYYEKQGQKYFTPDLGWWMSKKHYIEGDKSFGGVTREQIEDKYYSITIFETRDEAIAAAEKAGLV